VKLCVDLLSVCDVDAMRTFWECEEDGMQLRTWIWSKEFTCAVWRTFVEKWRDVEGTWEGGVILLGVPFTYVFLFLLLSFEVRTDKTSFYIVIDILGVQEAMISHSGRKFSATRRAKHSTME